MYKIVQHSSFTDFLATSSEHLSLREAENSLILGLCLSQTKTSETLNGAILLSVFKDGSLQTSAIQTPPYNLILSRSNPSALESLIEYMFSKGLKIPGVVGPKEEASFFVKTFSQKYNGKFELGMDQRIYECTEVIEPAVPGVLKVADPSDEKIVSEWLYKFSEESLPSREKISLQQAHEGAVKAISSKNAYFWHNKEGSAVSVAHTGRPTKRGISVRAVYTPPIYRKNGFGSAVVAGVTRRMLKAGYQFCCLYTDASNPTSNKIYESVGYKKVSDSNHYIFSDITV